MKKAIPNIFTFINLALGVLAILIVIGADTSENIVTPLVDASLIVMAAALMDRLDGKLARALEATSELGKQLDSLSDLISFGVAPMVIAWKICLMKFGVVGYILSIVFPVAGAYRLARFNVGQCKNSYEGIPITIAGAFLALDNLYNCLNLMNGKYSTVNSAITIILIVGLSLLMVSKFKFKKL